MVFFLNSFYVAAVWHGCLRLTFKFISRTLKCVVGERPCLVLAPRFKDRAPRHGAHYTYVILLHDCLAHSLRAVIALCVRFTECSIEFTSFNICARWIGFMLFSVVRTKKKRHQQTTQPIYNHSYMGTIICIYIEGFCVHVLQGIQSAQKHRTNQACTQHTTLNSFAQTK